MKNIAPQLGLALLLLLACLGASNAQRKNSSIPFDRLDYPDSSFVTTTQTYSHGECQIRIVHVKNVSARSASPFLCRAWLTIERKGKVLHRVCLPDIDAVGSSYGMFVPNRQPSDEYFAIVKCGDYDGRLYLVDTHGRLREYLGGEYVVTRFQEYLLSEYHSDVPQVEVIDLKNGDSLFVSPESFPEPSQWYFNGRGIQGYYFYTSGNSPDSMYVCDIQSKRFYHQRLDPAVMAVSEKIIVDFSRPANNDCGCAKYGKMEQH